MLAKKTVVPLPVL